MINSDLTSIEHFLETGQKHSFQNCLYLNLPELQFIHWCQQQYKINKGVYNTIDSWFFQKGIGSILNRRIYILAFLDFVMNTVQYESQTKYLRFGNGGLTKALQHFFDDIERS